MTKTQKEIEGIWYAGELCARNNRIERAKRAHQDAIQAAEAAGFEKMASQIRKSLKRVMTQ